MNILDEGLGELFSDPDPDAGRAAFRNKDRRMTRKLMPLKEAVEKFVKDGDYLGIGGFGANRTPIAACHEIVRQKKRNMAFAGHTATHDMQILCAGGVIDRLDVAYVVGLEARGLSKYARKAMESGQIKCTEWTNYCMTARVRAAAMGVPFLPIRNLMGTDTFKYSASKMVECPYTGKKVVLMPALYPDVSIIHVHEADVYGNARIRGITVSDLDYANASKKLIITTERLIHSDTIRNDPSLTKIPYFLVDAVCEVPFGGYPGTMPYEYFSDEDHIRAWLNAERDPETLKRFLDENIYGCRDHEEYIMKNGGLKRMSELRSLELMLSKEK